MHTIPFFLASTGPAILTVSPPKPAVPIAVGSPASQVLDDTTRKREVRLMKNRCTSCLFELYMAISCQTKDEIVHLLIGSNSEWMVPTCFPPLMGNASLFPSLCVGESENEAI